MLWAGALYAPVAAGAARSCGSASPHPAPAAAGPGSSRPRRAFSSARWALPLARLSTSASSSRTMSAVRHLKLSFARAASAVRVGAFMVDNLGISLISRWHLQQLLQRQPLLIFPLRLVRARPNQPLTPSRP